MKKLQNHPLRFVPINSPVKNQGDFEREYSFELRDFNSAGVVAANQGISLSKLIKNEYEVYGKTIQVSKEQSELCKENIEYLVRRL